MTVEQPRAEALGDHDYLVRLCQGEDATEIRMHASPAVVRRLAGSEVEEARVVEMTVSYLIQRQRADDLPISLDLDDVAAAYDGYIDEIQLQLNS